VNMGLTIERMSKCDNPELRALVQDSSSKIFFKNALSLSKRYLREGHPILKRCEFYMKRYNDNSGFGLGREDDGEYEGDLSTPKTDMNTLANLLEGKYSVNTTKTTGKNKDLQLLIA
jgi:hypothetical protein